MSNSIIPVDDPNQTGDDDGASIVSSERTVRRPRAASEASTIVPYESQSIKDIVHTDKELKKQKRILEIIDFIDKVAIRADFDQRQYDELTAFAFMDFSGMIRTHAVLIAERDRATTNVEREVFEWKISERLDNSIAKHALMLICCRKLQTFSSNVPCDILFDAICSLGKEIDVPDEICSVASMQEKLRQSIRRHWRRVKVFVLEKIEESFRLNFFGRQSHLYSLADSICRGSGIRPSLDFITFLAFLREEYVNNHDENYWRRIDHRLSHIYDDCKDDELALRGEMHLFLEKDLELYGSFDDLPHNVKYFYDQSVCSLEDFMNAFIEIHCTS